MIEFPKRVSRHNSVVFVLLINIIFLLIVYFLVSGTIKKPDFYPVNVPASLSLNQEEDPETFITMNIDGDMVIGNEFISEDRLEAVLKESFAKNKEEVISIKADSALDAKKLIRVINIVKKAGGRNIRLITQNYERP